MLLNQSLCNSSKVQCPLIVAWLFRVKCWSCLVGHSLFHIFWHFPQFVIQISMFKVILIRIFRNSKKIMAGAPKCGYILDSQGHRGIMIRENQAFSNLFHFLLCAKIRATLFVKVGHHLIFWYPLELHVWRVYTHITLSFIFYYMGLIDS